MILFGELQKLLPVNASLVHPHALPVKRVYGIASKSKAFHSTYPVEAVFRKAIFDSLFCITLGEGILLYFELFCETLTLRVHGLFLTNPFPFLPELQEIAKAVFEASTVQRLECLYLYPPSRGLDRLLRRIGFCKEGILRRAYRDVGGSLRDGTMYSILREEVLE
jgi:hypothetical protein